MAVVTPDFDRRSTLYEQVRQMEELIKERDAETKKEKSTEK